jgi:hypothetical protein
MKMEHGVLQKSVIKSVIKNQYILILLYVNNLIENVQGAKLVLFAYGSNLLITGED